jgi:hypothetical protein
MPASLRDPAAIGAELRSELLAARNPDGGWGFRAQNRSRIEPTCWALLALAHSSGQPPDIDVLRRWPLQDGWLVDVAGTPPNYAFNAIAALTFLQSAASAPLAEPVIDRLVGVKGKAFGPHKHLKQNNSLQAWSWLEGTFSWVEPTAWCVLLLKHRLAYGPIRGADERLRVAEEMLADRACRSGGWNYGNPYVFGKALPAYVPTTALTLLALQDRRGDPLIARALEELQKDVARERSSVALAMALIALRAYGAPTSACEQNLGEVVAQAPAGMTRTDNLLGLAMSIYALTNRRMAAFSVPKGS